MVLDSFHRFTWNRIKTEQSQNFEAEGRMEVVFVPLVKISSVSFVATSIALIMLRSGSMESTNSASSGANPMIKNTKRFRKVRLLFSALLFLPE
jgi:hypothetical protein